MGCHYGALRVVELRELQDMVAKPFLMMLLATVLGPAIGVGLFVLMQSN